MKVTDFGAILVSVLVPDKNGVLTDVVLGYDHGEDYQVNSPHFGATIGRNGNRIKNASFCAEWKKIQLTPNEKRKQSAQYLDGFEFMMWEAETKEQAVAFRHHSPDGEQGFPGNFDVTVTYTLTDDNAVEIHYEGISDQDTVANMTNHSYFNLGGHDSGNVYEQMIQLNATTYTPVSDSKSIPTGELAPVAGTPMDFTEPKAIGKEIDADFAQLQMTGGYDHNFVLINRKVLLTGWQKHIAKNRNRYGSIYRLSGCSVLCSEFLNCEKEKMARYMISAMHSAWSPSIARTQSTIPISHSLS